MGSAAMFGLFALLGVVVGLALGWFAGQSRGRAKAAADAAEATAAKQQEVTMLTERLNGLMRTAQAEQEQRERAARSVEDLRQKLDEASNTISRLEERSSRVPVLQAELEAAQDSLRIEQGKILQLTSAETEQRNLATTLASRRDELTSEVQRVTLQLQQTQQALQTALADRAALEQRGLQIPQLESELTRLLAVIADSNEKLLKLTEQATEHRNLAEAVTARRDELLREVEELGGKLQQAQASAQNALEAKAGLEQQVLQLNDLQLRIEKSEQALQSTEQALADLRESSSREIAGLSAQLLSERATATRLQAALDDRDRSLDALNRQVEDLTLQLAGLKISSEKDQESLREQLKTLERGREALAAEFKTLANDILEEKSKRFAEQNQANLGALLDPLKTKLAEFQGKVEEVYRTEGQERHALAEQVKALHALNQTLSKDAQNLTSALKGQAKVQGNWGELILERVLESAGLEKGTAYKVQDSQTREDGSRAQPDVVLELPEDRRLVIDAKVSLTAYERYASATSDEDRAVALKSHVQSIRGHIEGLSQKAYQDVYKLQSLDFVVAFVPVEGAFMLAVTHDENLFMDAWKRNVLLVSPSTLLFVVRTVAHLWRQEAQNRNAQAIAEAGRKLYEKFVGFVDDLSELGKKLEGAQRAYALAHGKLVSGRGNAIKQAEQLRDLGVKPNKTLPQPLVQAALDADDVVVQEEGLPLVESAPTIGQILGPGHSTA